MSPFSPCRPSPPAVTVSLPDFARGPGQTVNLPANTSTGIPVSLFNNSSSTVTVTSVSFNLAYDSSMLTITNAITTAPSGTIASKDFSTAGLAKVTFTSSTGITLAPHTGTGLNPFVNLAANVPTSAVYKSKEVLDLQTCPSEQRRSLRPATTRPSRWLASSATSPAIRSTVRATRWISPASRRTWTAASWPTPCSIRSSSGTSPVTGASTRQTPGIVASAAVGTAVGKIPALPSAAIINAIITGPDPAITIPTLTVTPGGTLTVPVNLDHSNGLDAVDLALSYDASRLDVTGIQPGSLLSEPGQDAAGNAWTFDSFLVNLDSASGTIRISAYRVGGGLEGFGSGSLLTIGFHVKDNAPAGAAAVTLRAGDR